jgi:hypothetical protein
MIKNPAILAKLEKELAASQPPDYTRELKIFEALYDEAVALGVLPLKDPLEGLDSVITLAHDMNHVQRTSGQTGR